MQNDEVYDDLNIINMARKIISKLKLVVKLQAGIRRVINVP